MNKKIIFSSLASLFFLSQVANAEFKYGSITATPGILFSTNNVSEFTGQLANRSNPTYGVDLNLAHDSGLYFYNIYKEKRNAIDSDEGTFDFELCSSLGFAKSVSNVNLDLSYENCHVDSKTEKNDGTYYARASYDVNKQLTLGAAYTWDTTGAVKTPDANNRNQDNLADAYKFFVAYDMGFSKGTVTYGESDNFSNYYSVGLNKDLFGVNFDLTYWNVEAENWINTLAPKLIERELVVLSVKKTF
jgi:hypothetical protein